MKKYRFMVIGAHPDDPDQMGAGLAMHVVPKGHEVMFLSLTDGGAGHHQMTREALVARRAEERKLAASIYGVTYEALPIPDGELTPSLEARAMLMKEIRAFAPDVIITHRTCDYHPDHRACGQLVMDCSYLVGVPLYCPDVPVPGKTPVILSYHDRFTRPMPFHAEIAIDTDDVIDRKLEGMLAHVSQFYEWLPWVDGWKDIEAAETFEEKTALLRPFLRAWFAKVADEARHLLPEGVETAESWEWNEYGAPMTDEILKVMTEK